MGTPFVVIEHEADSINGQFPTVYLIKISELNCSNVSESLLDLLRETLTTREATAASLVWNKSKSKDATARI